MQFRDVPLRAQLWIFVLVAALSGALAVRAFDYQLAALSAGGRDLGFFMAQYERLLDVPVWRGLAAQPSGNDAFGFAGLDGEPTLHHDIHFSPLKYVLAGVHLLTGAWWPVQLVLVLSVLAGLAYALVRFQSLVRGNVLALLALSALVLSPLFARGTLHDLRPVIALGAFVAALAAALLTRAPSRHLVTIAVLGLLVREEASVVLALAAAWLALDRRPREAWQLFGVAASYFVLFHVLYLAFSPFAYVPHAQIAAVWLSFAVAPALLLGPRRVTERLADLHARWRGASILLLGLPFVAILVDPFFNAHLARSALARAFPAALVVLLAGIYAVLTSASPRVRLWIERGLLVAIVPVLLASALRVSTLRSEAERQAEFWTLAAALPSDAVVLTDFAHYQAFAGRDRVLVWERLPSDLETPGGPDAPTERPALLDLLRRSDALWVMSPASYDDLTRALAPVEAAPRIERCEGPSSVVIARRARGRTQCPVIAAAR